MRAGVAVAGLLPEQKAPSRSRGRRWFLVATAHVPLLPFYFIFCCCCCCRLRNSLPPSKRRATVGASFFRRRWNARLCSRPATTTASPINTLCSWLRYDNSTARITLRIVGGIELLSPDSRPVRPWPDRNRPQPPPPGALSLSTFRFKVSRMASAGKPSKQGAQSTCFDFSSMISICNYAFRSDIQYVLSKSVRPRIKKSRRLFKPPVAVELPENATGRSFKI